MCRLRGREVEVTSRRRRLCCVLRASRSYTAGSKCRINSFNIRPAARSRKDMIKFHSVSRIITAQCSVPLGFERRSNETQDSRSVTFNNAVSWCDSTASVINEYGDSWNKKEEGKLKYRKRNPAQCHYLPCRQNIRSDCFYEQALSSWKLIHIFY